MDADQHRQEAERLLAQHSTDPEYVRLTVERAKVHALLAIEARLAGDMPDDPMVSGPPPEDDGTCAVKASRGRYVYGPCVRLVGHDGDHVQANGVAFSSGAFEQCGHRHCADPECGTPCVLAAGHTGRHRDEYGSGWSGGPCADRRDGEAAGRPCVREAGHTGRHTDIHGTEWR